MSIQFTLNRDILNDSRGETTGPSEAGHSRIAEDPRHAAALLQKLQRIHDRQAASGSPASEWDPRKIWQEMLKDCCSGAHPRT